MIHKKLLLSIGLLASLMHLSAIGADRAPATIHHRSHLPMRNTATPGLVTYDAKSPDTVYPPIEQLRPPAGAPNVLIVLIDDAGFGSSSAFGGPCQTPTLDKLAAGGLRYNRFHTTALCSPTRQALLTGRNHHSVGMGNITEIASGAPGYSSVLPNSMAPLARTLVYNGYSTAQFGKCHEVPVWQTSPAGPFDSWPTGGGGFEYFYGFIGGEANQWYPTLFEGTTPVELKKTPGTGLPPARRHDRQSHQVDRPAESPRPR
jgi:arylsulfatase A-like enzyme